MCRAMAEVFRYELCTHVQAQALPACLAGGDVLAKAKTGTGKTIGFMIPLIETVSACWQWHIILSGHGCIGRKVRFGNCVSCLRNH